MFVHELSREIFLYPKSQKIDAKEEGSLIPRGRETPDKIEGHELRDNETETLNMAIRVLTYTSHKWIIDPTHDVSVIIDEFWLLLIHTLHGQYECFTGNVDAIFRKQMHFKRLWDSMLIFREDGDHIIWMYIVPAILGNNVY